MPYKALIRDYADQFAPREEHDRVVRNIIYRCFTESCTPEQTAGVIQESLIDIIIYIEDKR
jgi:hypothetical protein